MAPARLRAHDGRLMQIGPPLPGRGDKQSGQRPARDPLARAARLKWKQKAVRWGE